MVCSEVALVRTFLIILLPYFHAQRCLQLHATANILDPSLLSWLAGCILYALPHRQPHFQNIAGKQLLIPIAVLLDILMESEQEKESFV